MQNIKFQFEIRYKHILDYHKHNRILVAPLLKRDDATVSIENVDTINEFIVINYPEIRLSIDFRIDRLLIVCEGNDHKLTKENGSIKHLFDLYNRIKDLETFTMPTMVVLGFWGVKIKDQSFESIVEEFKSNHYSGMNNLIEDLSDTAITIEKVSSGGKESERFDLGPFQESDINKQNISLMFEESKSELVDKNGILIKYINSKKTKEINFANFMVQYNKLKHTLNAVDEMLN
jgi:hypothetical protein